MSHRGRRNYLVDFEGSLRGRKYYSLCEASCVYVAQAGIKHTRKRQRYDIVHVGDTTYSISSYAGEHASP